jgi:cation transport ATPase
MNAPHPASGDIVNLRITGMTCAACAARIEKALNRLPGVSASVNLATEYARVRVGPGAATAQRLIEAVERAGYSAEVVAGADPAADKTRRAALYRQELRQFWIATALTLPLVAQMAWMLAGHHGDLLPRWLQLTLATLTAATTTNRVHHGKPLFRGRFIKVRSQGALTSYAAGQEDRTKMDATQFDLN